MDYETALLLGSMGFSIFGFLLVLIEEPVYIFLLCYLLATMCLGFAGIIAAIEKGGDKE